jgi:hypothetical protein
MQAKLNPFVQFIVTLGLLTAPAFAGIPLKAVWYQASRSSLFGELADTSNHGNTLTPRQAAIETLDDNFSYIAGTLKANAVLIRLGDDDDWFSQYGGGMPYDPDNNPAPQKAVGEEIVLSLANKHGLKVIFAIDFSGYHINISDTYGSNPPYPNTAGAYQYIHALIDPTPFYCGGGCPSTTDLVTYGGLSAESQIRSYYNDSRVAGWLFGGEWCTDSSSCGSSGDPLYSTHQAFINKYWNFFYSLVHWGSSTTGFAGIYTIAGPDALVTGRIDSLKSMFNGTGNTLPDQLGFEWYGNGSYSLGNVATDLATLAAHVLGSYGGYTLSASQVILAEGGSNQTDNSAKQTFYSDAIAAIANLDGAGNPAGTVGAWTADSYNDAWGATNGNTSCSSIFGSGQEPWAVFSTPTFSAQSSCASYSPPPTVGWHYMCGTTWTSSSSWCNPTTSYTTQYGTFSFSGGLKDYGTSLATAYTNH